ncbi:uracil phosphoribosyltransferase [Arcticibacter tournemirensis]|uniref:Uracil phosphoribosyltransferase n=1 Tax=Arcticibacter tournemirensis TaxID=699437 RepID=A0A5M9H373_9SPHI|nr:uracil phosphoribosyltransferase [Arcticibacter tournemirensis]KAA8481383.1 uracil phosphoribosyltransferase [Arcticibacter tournemirensis]TQM48966.1 uracil phosphoribosyltransferase [Arcticibacter tournemirensis]
MFVLNNTPSIGNNFLAELRDAQIQQDSMRFRKNLERLGEIFAYEISKTLAYIDTEFETPLGTALVSVVEEHPVLATILRAGLPLHQGLLNYFDKADSAFIAAYRQTTKDDGFVIQKEYVTSPDLNGKIVIVADTMLATGRSIVLSCKELLDQYKIKQLHIVSVIASTEGVAYVKANLPKARLWLGAVDEEMTTKAYIVPGLGDAGDLAFGIKE